MRDSIRTHPFNGAATLQSRKFGLSRGKEKKQEGLQWGRDSSVAEIWYHGSIGLSRGKPSMGPRLFSRGNRSAADGSVEPLVLQWGRDSSVAEIPSLLPAPPALSQAFNGAATLQSRKYG